MAPFWPIVGASSCAWGRGFGEARMRKLVVALAAIAVLTAPAHAQSRGKGSKRSENSQQTDDKKQKKAAAEKAYKDALHSVPEQKNSDPWAKMR
jgi:phage head maturation protease